MACTCGHCSDKGLDDIVLESLKEALERYPELKQYLTGVAKQVAEDGVERHQKIQPRHRGDYVFTPGVTELTEDDIEKAVSEWDRLMPDYAGLLDAEVRIDENAQ